jgi:hypothetical protein
VVAHFGHTNTVMRQWIYGAGDPVGNELVYIQRHERHLAEVRDYFRSRPNDLLVFDASTSSGWPEMCAFLEKDVPAVPFPHANSRQQRNSVKVRMKRFVRDRFLSGRR